uniref:Secreted peptide n=1 Tax=Rhipicephalus pulchellus TaxID=72859 RepID=L7M9D2_RHIPC
MIRASLLLLLALGTASQALRTYRFRYLKTNGLPPRGDRRTTKPAPKSDSEPETSFLMPIVPVGSVTPAFPPVVTGSLPLQLVTPTAPFVAANPPTVIPTGPVVAPAAFVSSLTRPENLTLTSRLSSGPSVTTTVFRAPGGVSATSVQRVEGSSTAFFSEADTLRKVKPKPVSVIVPATVGTVPQVVQAAAAPTTVLTRSKPSVSYLFYTK